MAEAKINPMKEIHKECGTEMITLVLADRSDNLTYCPKCVSEEELTEILAPYRYWI